MVSAATPTTNGSRLRAIVNTSQIIRRSLSAGASNPGEKQHELPVKERCGAVDCAKDIRVGIRCCHCVKLFHQACSNLTNAEFRKYRTEDDTIWFCGVCNQLPVANCLLAFNRKLNATLSQSEARTNERIHMLEKKLFELAAKLDATSTSNNSNKFNGNSPKRARILVKEADNVAAPKTINPGGISNSSVIPNSWRAVSDRPAYLPRKVKAPTDVRKEALTVICSNLPESDKTSLRDRQEDEKRNWGEVCRALGIADCSSSLTRLSRPAGSAHTGKPRLLRVTLKSVSAVETILLEAFKLRNTDSIVRVFPDIPWAERTLLKQKSEEAKDLKIRKTLMVHGVPELSSTEDHQNRAHDCAEWKFIQQLLGVSGALTTAVDRLPSSSNYRGTGPRILRITLHSVQMADEILGLWYSNRQKLPPEVRIRPSHAVMVTHPHHPNISVPASIPVLATSSSTDAPQEPMISAKNFQVPTPKKSAPNS